MRPCVKTTKHGYTVSGLVILLGLVSLSLVGTPHSFAQAPIIAGDNAGRNLHYTPVAVGDTYSLQYSTNLCKAWQNYALLTNQVVTNSAMMLQVPNLGSAAQFFRIAENVWSPYVFPAYTNVPVGFSGQIYLTNPVLSIRPDWDPGVARDLTNGYLAFREGPDDPPQISDSNIMATMTRINGDLAYIIQIFGYRNHPSTSSNYINFYLLGSGLPGDTTPTTNTPETGFQGWRNYNNVTLPVVEMTYQDFLPPDDYHRWTITHEFVHVTEDGYGVFSDTYGGWFNEAHNNYILDRLREYVTGGATLGWLDPYGLMASYMPIESYAMNADGTPSGPGMGSVSNSVNGSYGGYCYSTLFPMFLFQRVGPFFNNALWEQATSTESVLQTATRLLGTNQTKQMLVEYGARNAILDYQEFSTNLAQFLIQQWPDPAGNWFYTATTNQNGWLTPSDTMRLPRHTGRNNIPVAITPGAHTLAVAFTPDAAGSKGSVSDMRAQLVYRATNGVAIFSQPVTSGVLSLQLSPAPTNGIVILVITSVKLNGYAAPAIYGWDPTETFGYKVQIQSGGVPADIATLAATGLGVPTGLSATAGNSLAVLSWSTAGGAMSYNVKRSTTSGSGYATVTNVATTSWTNTGLVNGTTYYYVVSAVNAGGQSTNSTQASVTPQLMPLAAPTGLSATAGNTQATLNWNVVTNATSYNVKRSTTGGGGYAMVTNVATTGCADTGLVNGTTYYYVVSAVNAGGESTNSTPASATPQMSAPSAPTGLRATAGNAQVTLNWSASAYATSYNVKRSTTNASGYATITNLATTSYTNTSLANGTPYYYVVTAVNAGGESINSTQVSATPVLLAGVISVNYCQTGDGLPGAALAGAVRTNNWNSVIWSSSPSYSNPTNVLFDCSRTAVSRFGVQLSNDNRDTWNSGNTSQPDQLLCADWALGGGGTAMFTNVPYASYDLYVYFNGFGANTVNYTIGATTQTLADSTSAPVNFSGTYVSGTDYVKFSGLTNANLVLTVAGVRGGVYGLAAFQIISH